MPPIEDIDANDMDALFASAIEQHSAETAPEEPDATDATSETGPPAEAAGEPAEAEAAADPAERVEKKPTAGDRARDESGKFTKAAKAKAAAAPAAKVAAISAKPVVTPKVAQPQPGATPPAPAPEALKPPQSWKPGPREKWGTLPREVQEEAIRLDKEIRQGLQESADDRKYAQAFRQQAAPYEAMFRAQGDDPLQAAAKLFQAQYILTHGSPQQKAQGLANLINQSGVDLDAINAHLSGKPPPAQGQPQAQNFDPQRFKQELFQEFRQQAVSHRATQEIQQVANEEFFADVREDMADIVAAAARRGVAMTAKQAYDRACKVNPDVSDILAQRAKSKAVTATQAATRRAEQAGSSVRSSPATTSTGEVDARDLDAVVRAAIAAHSGG